MAPTPFFHRCWLFFIMSLMRTVLIVRAIMYFPATKVNNLLCSSKSNHDAATKPSEKRLESLKTSGRIQEKLFNDLSQKLEDHENAMRRIDEEESEISRRLEEIKNDMRKVDDEISKLSGRIQDNNEAIKQLEEDTGKSYDHLLDNLVYGYSDSDSGEERRSERIKDMRKKSKQARSKGKKVKGSDHSEPDQSAIRDSAKGTKKQDKGKRPQKPKRKPSKLRAMCDSVTKKVKDTIFKKSKSTSDDDNLISEEELEYAPGPSTAPQFVEIPKNKEMFVTDIIMEKEGVCRTLTTETTVSDDSLSQGAIKSAAEQSKLKQPAKEESVIAQWAETGTVTASLAGEEVNFQSILQAEVHGNVSSEARLDASSDVTTGATLTGLSTEQEDLRKATPETIEADVESIVRSESSASSEPSRRLEGLSSQLSEVLLKSPEKSLESEDSMSRPADEMEVGSEDSQKQKAISLVKYKKEPKKIESVKRELSEYETVTGESPFSPKKIQKVEILEDDVDESVADAPGDDRDYDSDEAILQ